MPKRILVVEDEPDNAHLLRLLLENSGYDVRSAETLAAARVLLAEPVPPDLVLLDLLLPEGDALEFSREVKASQPSLPIIVITAQVNREVREKALTAGCAHFLPKPFEPETLEAVVRLVLGDAPDRRRLPRAG